MTREEVIAVATDWLQGSGHSFGSLRYARYLWDFRSGLGLACDNLARHFVYIPSPFGPGVQMPRYFQMEQGWLVVFNPPERDAENSDECVVVWVDESRGTVQGRVPGRTKSCT